MIPQTNLLLKHLTISCFLYILFASLDIHFTLKGIQGDISLEGNPIMQLMMEKFGLLAGLIIEKSIVFVLAFAIALIAFHGIDKQSNWVYYLALTKMTRIWMKQKKRYIVAFLPLYLVALAQGLAAFSWIYLMFFNG